MIGRSHTVRLFTLLLVLATGVAAIVATSSCGHETTKGEAKPQEAVSAAPPALSREAQIERNQRAAKLFVAECSGCHGERGRGDGPAAAVLDVKPRDFVHERFKVRSTRNGDAPTREDILATIARGMPGSAMPSFKFLTAEQREMLADYVWQLARLGDKKPGRVVEIGDDPGGGAESVARGKGRYENLGCGGCHGPEGRGDGSAAKGLKDDLSRPIKVRDLVHERFRGGDDAAAVAMRFTTGMDGTPMPSFTDNLDRQGTWDLAHYVVSLRAPAEALPSDRVAAGRQVVAERHCYGCHVIEGRGARVGPSLDVSAQKLRYGWAKKFLHDPRAVGKIYPYLPYRMPNLGLSDAEIDGVLALFAHVANRTYPEPAEAAEVVQVDAKQLDQGKLLYLLKCTECHNLGTVVPTPDAKRQGPDLINVSERLRFDWIAGWVKNPTAIYPDTRMVKTNLTDEEVEMVRAFIWSASTSKGQAHASD